MSKSTYMIIDAAWPMKRFLMETGFFTTLAGETNKEYMEEYLDSILDRVIDCVSHEQMVQSRLWDYANELRFEGEIADAEREGETLARSIVALGEGISDQLRALKAYDEKRQLGYYITGRIANSDLILERI